MSLNLTPLLLVLFLAGSISAAYWGSFARDNCIAPGYRKYYSRLWDISGDWMTACRAAPATVAGVYFQAPDVCTDKGIAGQWGEFFVRDTSCNPTWGSFKDDGCRNRQVRQYSSILWGIPSGQSWEDWCSKSLARVRGTRFPRPTRCVNTNLNIWGEFDVVDPCCSTHTELFEFGPYALHSPHLYDNTTLRALWSDDSCEDDEDEPPFPNPSQITTAADATRVLRSGADPFRIAAFLWAVTFRVIVSNTVITARAADYYAVVSNFVSPPGLSFQSTAETGDYAAIRALLVPTVPGSNILAGNGLFPAGTFGQVDVANPSANVICTAQLTGCCLAFGWDNAQGRLYMGHAQPDSSFEAISNRANMANYLRQNGRFPGAGNLQMTFFGGDDSDWAYGGDRANVVGFVSQNCVYILVQVVDAGRDIIRGWMWTFYRQ